MGKTLSEHYDRASSILPGAEAERRAIAVMSCDLVDSSALVKDLEPFDDLISEFRRLVSATVRQFGGRVGDFAGDGAFVHFGVPPTSEENYVEQAIRAGRVLINEVGRIKSKYALRLRVGIATGPVIIRGGIAVGPTAHLAQRLQELAAPNTLVICEATHGRAGAMFSYETLQKVEPPGFHAIGVWRVVDEAGPDSRFAAYRESRGLSSFVGRSDELAVLERHVGARGDNVLFIDIAGDAGIGKSRLLHEFKRAIGYQRALVLTGNCSPDGKQTVFLPFIDVVRRTCQVSIGESEDRVREKLGRLLEHLGLQSDLNIALLMNLIGLALSARAFDGLDSALVGLRTRDLLLEVLRSHTRTTQLILLVEDLQWIDGASEELLERIASAQDISLLVITTRRPAEFKPTWLERANTVQLPLNRLSDDQMKLIIVEQLGKRHESESTAAVIARKAEGNPFFAEEMARYLAVGSMFTGETSEAVPDTIKDLLTRRVDQVGAINKQLLQVAAVIGRNFAVELVTRVTRMADCENRFAEMADLDILVSTEVPGQFAFKHVLLRQALYEDILKRDRALFHAMVADAIEQQSADRLKEVAEVLAHHYSQTELVAKAFRFSFMSGEKSFGVYSLEEANQYFGHALNFIEKARAVIDHEEIGRLVAAYLQVLGLQAKYPDVTTVFERYRAELEQLEDKRSFVLALNSTCFAYFMQMKFASAREMATLADKVSAVLSDDSTRAYALAALIFSQPAWRTRPQEDFKRLEEEAIEKSERGGDGFIRVRLLFDLAWYYLSRGDFQKGHKYAHDLMQFGVAQNDQRAIGFANWTYGLQHVCHGNYSDALRHSEEALRFSLTT